MKLLRILVLLFLLLTFTDALKMCYKLPKGNELWFSLLKSAPEQAPDVNPSQVQGKDPVQDPPPQEQQPKETSPPPAPQDQSPPNPDQSPQHGAPPTPNSQPDPSPMNSQVPASGGNQGSSAGGSASADNNKYLAEAGLTSGDLPRCSEGSGHLDMGLFLNTEKLNAIFDHIGLPPIREAVSRLNGLKALFEGLPLPNQIIGAYLAWSVAAKFKILAPNGKSQDENELTYGALKRAGMDNNDGEVDRILNEKGADKYGISTDLMAYLWGTNEHQCLHAYLFGNECIRNSIHATSLNDQDSADYDDHPDEPDGIRGGFNDKGMAPQWGIWAEAPNYLSTLGLSDQHK